MTEDEVVELGGNISLVNSKIIPGERLIVVKKIIGNHVKDISNQHKDFKNLKIHFKKVHESEIEMQGTLSLGNEFYKAEVTNFNIFYAIDDLMNKLRNQIKVENKP